MMKRTFTGLSTLLAGCAISHVGANEAVDDVAAAETSPHDFGDVPALRAGLSGAPGRVVGAALCVGLAGLVGCSASHVPYGSPEAAEAPLVVGEWSQSQQGCGPDYTTYYAFAADGSLVMRGVMEDFDGAVVEQERSEGSWELDDGVLTWRFLVGEREVEMHRVLTVLDAEPFGMPESGARWWSHSALGRVGDAYTQHDWSGSRSLVFDRALDTLGECRVTVEADARGEEGTLGAETFEVGCRVVESEQRAGLWEVQIDMEDAPSLEGEERELANALNSLRPRPSYLLDPAQTDALVPHYATPDFDGFLRVAD